MITYQSAKASKYRLLDELSSELYAALRARRVVPRLISRHPALTVDDAYAISRNVLARRMLDGERLVGKKIGVTSKAVQAMLGVHEPDFGFLTDQMWVKGATIDIERTGLIQPRVEAEIALILRSDVHGPGVTAEDVRAATESMAPCFEIVDSRIENWHIGIVDTVADNASGGVFVIGEARADPRSCEPAGLRVTVTKNNTPLSYGDGSAVQGSPLQAVAWLANTLGTYDVTLNAGEIILSGSLVPLEPAVRGDVFEMELHGVGSCIARFI